MMRQSLRLFGQNAAAIIFAVALLGCGENRDQTFASAKADLLAGDSSTAVIRLRSVLQTDPQFADARLLLGQVLLEIGDPAAAEKELGKAFEAGIATDTVKPLLARALLELGDYQKLLSDFPAQQITVPEARADVLVSQAYAQIFQGHVEEAKQALRQAREATPGNLRAATVAALIMGVEGDFAGASLAIDEVLSQQPQSIEALRTKASIAQGQGDLAVAIQTLQTLAQLRPFDVAAHFKAIMLLGQVGRLAEARAQASRMRAAAPLHPRTEHVLALMAIQDQKFVEAREHVARALKWDPEFAPTLLLSGVVNSQLGAYELAEQDLSKVLTVEPNNLLAQQKLIELMLKTQRSERALVLTQQLLALAPDQAQVLVMAAAVHLQLGDAKTALSLFERAKVQGGTDAAALTGLALARMASGDASAGVVTLMEASALDESGIDADLFLVKYYLGLKEFDKAFESLATMAGKRPLDPRILRLEGEILVAADRKAEARTAFETAYELQPTNVAPLRHLGRLDLAEGTAERASMRFASAIARRPQDATLLLAYAEWLNDSKSDPDTVRATIERALAVAPDDVGARLALVAFHARQGDLDRALAAAEEAATAIPGNERLLAVLTDIQTQMGRPDLAIVTLLKAIRVAPDSPQLLLRLADLQLTTGATNAARDSLRKALDLRPAYSPAIVRLVALEERVGSPERAIEAARELRKLQPSAAIGFALEGQVLLRQGNSAEAIRVFTTGIQASNAPQLVIDLHGALVKAGKAEEAANVAANWIKVNPKDLLVRGYLANLALQAKDYRVAVRLYEELLADSPNNALALNNLAVATDQLGDWRALGYAEQANRLAPDNPHVLDTLGWILVERGDLRRGIELLRRAVATDPDAPDLRLNLAKALVKSGDAVGARRELVVLAKLGDQYPRQDEVRTLLAKL